MAVKKIRNMGASVRARLLNVARERNQDFELVLLRYALERLLYRLSISTHSDRFVLKGAMLLTSWFEDTYRYTRDLDLLALEPSNADTMATFFKEVLATDTNDGVEFDVQALHVYQMRVDMPRGVLRLRTTASISGARVLVMVDIGFGDVLEPGAEVIDYPSMLGFPAPRLKAYALETAIAEKFYAMVTLGAKNSRVKDFYDLWFLSESHSFDNDRLARAIAAVFEQRGTDIPTELPYALTPAFAENVRKQTRWDVFLKKVVLDPGSFNDVIAKVAEFIMPHARAAAALLDERQSVRF